MRTTTKWMAVGAGMGIGWALGRAMIGNAAGVVAAILSDFEARRTDIPATAVGVHRTVRTPSAKLPPRLKADIEFTRSVAAQKEINLVEESVPAPR
jgi:hypothetical protein